MKDLLWWFILMYEKFIGYPIYRIKVRHTICCTSCHKVYHQFKRYKEGQPCLCKTCRDVHKVWDEKVWEKKDVK